MHTQQDFNVAFDYPTLVMPQRIADLMLAVRLCDVGGHVHILAITAVHQ
jgi:hypothetical protein